MSNKEPSIGKELELKKQATIAFFSIMSRTTFTLKELLLSKGFIEITEITPIIMGDSSEGQPLCVLETPHHYEKILMDMPLFTKIKETFPKELEVIRNHHPFKTLKDVGEEVDPYEYLDTISERKLSQLIEEKYNTKFYMLHRLPLEGSPFYIMPCADDPRYGNSFAVFLRGKIISGGQCINDPKVVEKRLRKCKLKVSNYTKLFRDGTDPHG
ncbi:aspartate--tRNA ligase 1, cytoplasmic-like [Eutrema salsugineum]|uniref:aspartate--tRNA ligase 1, cytoplasmic-like n=1 Tax=Eutrema salsugineum TaxID=72664 RepID=UPI000CED0BF1|nr:aspartate--tRNA ligase 1, cytoplasmic-like [Eutrema salsugineum]